MWQREVPTGSAAAHPAAPLHAGGGGGRAAAHGMGTKALGDSATRHLGHWPPRKGDISRFLLLFERVETLRSTCHLFLWRAGLGMQGISDLSCSKGGGRTG